MNTLIAYATKYGCTEKCAKLLAEKLTGNVKLCNLKNNSKPDINKYDKIIIGGSVYMGKIRKEVNKFCNNNFKKINQKKIGLFICGMEEQDKTIEHFDDFFPKELISKAITKNSFGGEFIFKNMNMMERFIIKKVSKEENDISKILSDNIEKFANEMNNA